MAEQSRAQELTGKLRSLREKYADLPEDERRGRFREALEDNLAGLPDAEAGKLIASVRDQLIDDARRRESRLAEQEAELEQLRSRVDALSVENGRLAGENQRLRDAPATPGGGGQVLDTIREGLRKMAEEKEVTAESLGLDASAIRLFRMLQALLGFVLNYELSVNILLAEFRVGAQGMMNTQQLRGLMQEVPARFRSCLDDEEGSIAALRQALATNSRFLIDLNSAYRASVFDGGQSLLSSFDPQPLMDKHRGRVIGINYEEAFNEISRKHGDLSNLTREELWDHFFDKPFTDKLGAYLDSASGA